MTGYYLQNPVLDLVSPHIGFQNNLSEYGPRVTSDEFKQFVGTNGNKHTLVPAYHPSSNGAAERSVPI